MLSLILILLFQGVPVPASQSGSISGVLSTSTGKPAVGVRVSALTRPESPLDSLTASAMASLAETDQNGVYKLENVPPGRYYLIAGRVDRPTYYPGTLEMIAGKDVLITPGAAIAGMNFAMMDHSEGRADTNPGVSLATSWSIPVRVTLEGGGKIPVFDNGLFPVLRLTRVGDNHTMDIPLTSPLLVVPLAANPEYRVAIENLSKRYTVKTVVSGNTNLMSDLLKLPPPSAPIPLTRGSALFVSAGGQEIRADGSTGTVTIISGNTRIVSMFSSLPASIVPPLPPVPTLEVTLAEVAGVTSRTGATLSGMVPLPFGRGIEVSGIAGTIYADGAFEVKNVPPGRHIILTRNNPAGTRPVGASIIVGDDDIHNVRLQPILEIPKDFDAGIATTLRGTQNPGTIMSLATVRGRLVDEATGERFDRDRSIGRITVNGNTVSYTLDNAGDFEIHSLLPGRYDLHLWTSGDKTYTRTLDVRDEDLTIEWPVPALD